MNSAEPYPKANIHRIVSMSCGVKLKLASRNWLYIAPDRWLSRFIFFLFLNKKTKKKKKTSIYNCGSWLEELRRCVIIYVYVVVVGLLFCKEIRNPSTFYWQMTFYLDLCLIALFSLYMIFFFISTFSSCSVLFYVLILHWTVLYDNAYQNACKERTRPYNRIPDQHVRSWNRKKEPSGSGSRIIVYCRLWWGSLSPSWLFWKSNTA